jgi:hypothetical protein
MISDAMEVVDVPIDTSTTITYFKWLLLVAIFVTSPLSGQITS